MSTLDSKKHYHDATPTWSGFNHQGQVALLIALDLINEKNIISFEEASPYKLELEWIEDIAIKKNEEYVSIHQVKAYKSNNLSLYSDAIWMLLGKSYHFNIQNSYLHTVMAVTHDSENIKALEAGDKSTCYKEVILQNNVFDEVHSKFASYSYEGEKNYCELTEIDGLIKKRIGEYINKLENVPKTSTQIDITYLLLSELIHINVLKRHSKIQQGLVTQNNQSRTDIDCVAFSDILAVLFENYEESSGEYYIQELKKIFCGSAEEFLVDLNEQESTKEEIESFLLIVNYISALEKDDFLLFCKMISPNEKVNVLNLSSCHTLLPKYGLYDSFFNAINTIKRAPEKDRNEIKYILDNKIYLPTAINASDRQARNIARKILNNETMLDYLFHIDTMISERIEMESIAHFAEKINEISPSEMGEVDVNNREEDRITRMKKIRMVTINTSKEELN
ncbi:ABC-three component system protein [Bacillus sp. 22475]|uniref:ABC-three component system protein n=1 Tax=Bacillus sp. 22475 TaxID=3453925 RepID=UPI003F862146